MKKIALIAVNANCHEREEKLKEFLRNELLKHNIEMIQFSTHYIEQMVKQAKKEADKIFIVFDAKEGMNPTFSYAASELYMQEIKPTLIISNVDEKNVDLNYAKNVLAEIWSIENPELETWDLNFNTLYFSYKKMGFDTTPKVIKSNIQILIDEINNE